MNIETLAKLIKQKYGAVRRARGAFLYTTSGKRLLDMYLAGGRAILGWRAASAHTLFKNVFDRGALGSYDTGYWTQVQQAVNALFADGKEQKRLAAAFTSKREAMRTAYSLSKESTMFWRPWSSEANADCIIFAPPFPWGERLYLLAAKECLCANGTLESAPVPAPLAAAIARSIYDLKAQLPCRTEKDWFTHDKVLNRLWHRQGPYLYPKTEAAGTEDGAQYDAFAAACLDCGVVVSPDYNTPSIITPMLDKGVFKKLSSIALHNL